MSDVAVIRIPPFHYIHVLDNNTHVTRVESGPQTFTRQEHEKLIAGPEAMIMIPPRHYCVISNPVLRDAEGRPTFDAHGTVRLNHGDEEVRLEGEPFGLYPGEKLYSKVTPLQVVAENSALRLRCTRDFLPEGHKKKREAGEEWLFEGPGTYVPRVEIQVVEVVKAVIVKPNEALQLRARRACTDKLGHPRRAGEEWLVTQIGAYLPGVDEDVVETVKAHILTPKTALHLRAVKTFTDYFGKERKAGEEWLVTVRDAESYIPSPLESIVGSVKINTLNDRQYCVVLDPCDETGRPQLGKRILRKGPQSFFLLPGESFEQGIQAVHVLGKEEALLLRAKEVYEEEGTKHEPGDRWMIPGPAEYIPPVEVEILEKRRATPLDQNEGIYVRDIRTGKVRAVCGQSYMMQPHEELWDKELPKAVEELLYTEGAPRQRNRVVTYRASHNTAVQIYDYKEKKARVVFGPNLIMLGPDEHFTVLSLSGDKPKKPHQIKAIGLYLGPDFMTDLVTVETSDHARLMLKLSYNWVFEVEKNNLTEAEKIFTTPDFVGEACKAVAARVRGAVASVTFDSFHKNSAKIIRTAVFGLDEAGKVKPKYCFHANNLALTNVDIQSAEPVDQKTRDSLQKSVQLAIEITTSSTEAYARHEAEKLDQDARGRLERQKLHDEAEAEKARKKLLQLQAQSAAVESTGQATAEAKARAEASQIEGEASVKQAQLKAAALKIKGDCELEHKKKQQILEIDHQRVLNALEISKSKDLAEIESLKFKSLVNAIGVDAIKAIARAGPEMQVKLLEGLGLKSVMITDGNSPINLFNTAHGLISAAQNNQ